MAAGLIACYKGISVGGGPAGVGNAVNETVVYTFVTLFAINIIATAGERVDHPIRHMQHRERRGCALPARHPHAAGWVGEGMRIGEQAQFYAHTIAAIPDALFRYKIETLRLIAQIGRPQGRSRSSAARRWLWAS